MSNEFYSDHYYSESSYSSSTEEEYDGEYILDATTIDEELFITPHGELTSSSDEDSNIANNGSGEEDALEESINTSDEETHNYSSVSDPSDHEGHIRSHHRVNRITMYSGEEDMFEYSDGDVRLPTRWHEGDEREVIHGPILESTTTDSEDETNNSDIYDEGEEETNDSDLPENILEYLDEITFENDCQKSKIVTDQCKYTLDENVKCFKCHSCGETYSAEGIMENHSYHLKGKLPECPTCKTPIEISVLLELFDKQTVQKLISTHFEEQLSTPVFEAYKDTVKLLHENGYINPDSDKKTIIEFLRELVQMRDSPERPIPLDTPQDVYEYTKMLERFITESIKAFSPMLNAKRMQLMDKLNELPVKYGFCNEPVKPVRELRNSTAEYIRSNTIIHHGKGNESVKTYHITTPSADIDVHERVIGQSPPVDATFKGYLYADSSWKPTCIPEIQKYIPDNTNDYNIITNHRSVSYVPSEYSNIIQLECIIIKKHYILMPRLLTICDTFRGTTEQRFNAVLYYIEFAKLLAEYVDIEPYRSKLLFNACDLHKEYENWRQTYNKSIHTPSEIIGMTYQQITENGAIDADFKASNYMRTYSIFKRYDIPLQVLIDATIDAMLPMATPAQRRIINEMLIKNEKANPFHRCPLLFLKALTVNTELLCSCGGPILEHECLLCNRQYCPHCHEHRDYYHKCNPAVLETIKVLDSTTIRCPKCLTRIQKSEGCNHMFCIKCHCNFDWEPGKIIKVTNALLTLV